MQPTPAEVIHGVRKILKEVIQPHVDSPYALARLGEIRAVLAQVDWDNALYQIMQNNASVAALAQEVLEWANSVRNPSPGIISLRSDIAELLSTSSDEAAPFEVHNAQQKAWDHLMIQCSRELLQRSNDVPTDHEATSLHDRIQGHYAMLGTTG
jgi:hypothetical protein